MPKKYMNLDVISLIELEEYDWISRDWVKVN